MTNMLINGLAVNQYIIKVNHHEFSNESKQNLVH
jgi:hypothetical protein